LEHFAERVILSRRERQSALAGYAQRYALRLETYCQRAPLQWFNFFDFWQETTQMNMTPVSLGTLNQKPKRHEH
jgi:predicted LPLAT superfamily acyltransferase